MTATLPADAKRDMILFVQRFINTPSRRQTLHDFQELMGYMNWGLNVYPLLRPALCNLYDKTRGKTKRMALIYINKAVVSDLQWFLEHVKLSSGLFFFANVDWDPYKDAELTILCDACLEGMGFWIPELLLGSMHLCLVANIVTRYSFGKQHAH
jgi:hypothetical protein